MIISDYFFNLIFFFPFREILNTELVSSKKRNTFLGFEICVVTSQQKILFSSRAILPIVTGILKTNFDSKIKLVLFGSSRNGFGFKGSDMDLCLLFDDHPTEPPEKYKNPIKGKTKLFYYQLLPCFIFSNSKIG